jgi:hypothetical protein
MSRRVTSTSMPLEAASTESSMQYDRVVDQSIWIPFVKECALGLHERWRRKAGDGYPESRNGMTIARTVWLRRPDIEGRTIKRKRCTG